LASARVIPVAPVLKFSWSVVFIKFNLGDKFLFQEAKRKTKKIIWGGKSFSHKIKFCLANLKKSFSAKKIIFDHHLLFIKIVFAL
jgi:hypothetical protein